MDVILQGILVTGATDEEHYRHLEEVFRRLQYHGITVSQSKCKFYVTQLSIWDTRLVEKAYTLHKIK